MKVAIPRPAFSVRCRGLGPVSICERWAKVMSGAPAGSLKEEMMWTYVGDGKRFAELLQTDLDGFNARGRYERPPGWGPVPSRSDSPSSFSVDDSLVRRSPPLLYLLLAIVARRLVRGRLLCRFAALFGEFVFREDVLRRSEFHLLPVPVVRDEARGRVGIVLALRNVRNSRRRDVSRWQQ